MTAQSHHTYITHTARRHLLQRPEDIYRAVCTICGWRGKETRVEGYAEQQRLDHNANGVRK